MKLKICLIIPVVFLFGCWPFNSENNENALSEREAITLAESLANEECFKRYSKKPFGEDTYKMELVKDRWSWGALDIAGVAGFSAAVSFDLNGRNKTVEVFYSSGDLIRVKPKE